MKLKSTFIGNIAETIIVLCKNNHILYFVSPFIFQASRLCFNNITNCVPQNYLQICFFTFNCCKSVKINCAVPCIQRRVFRNLFYISDLF